MGTSGLPSYWHIRLSMGWPPSVCREGREHPLLQDDSASAAESVRKHLCGEHLLTTPCRVCGDKAQANKALSAVSCGQHELPLCQSMLAPLLCEPHVHCHFCDRFTTSPAVERQDAEIDATAPAWERDHSVLLRDVDAMFDDPLPNGTCAFCGSFVASYRS